MKRLFVAFTLSSVFMSFACNTAMAGSNFKKVLVIYFENTDYAAAMKQPYFQKLTKQGASLQNMYGLVHPSQGNYVALLGGDLMGVVNDNPVNINQSNLVDLLEKNGYSWKSYAENYPGHCFTGSVQGRYVRKHNPFVSFTNITQNPQRCALLQDDKSFNQDADSGNLPDFSMYAPNLDDDGHDTGVAYAASWLQNTFDNRLNDPNFMKDLLVVLTFDESSKTGGNHIYTVLLGSGIAPGSSTQQSLTHINILKTIENEFNLGDLGRRDTNAEVIQGIWK